MDLPQELYQIIFQYLQIDDLYKIISLDEFKYIHDNNNFWKSSISIYFPKYYIEKVYDYNFHELFYGLNFILNIDLYYVRTRGLQVNNLFWLTPSSEITILESYLDIRSNFTLLGTKEDIIERIIDLMMTDLIKLSPSTFKYLVKNNLLISENPQIQNKITEWMVISGDNELLDILIKKYPTMEDLLQKSIMVNYLNLERLEYIYKSYGLNPTSKDYLYSLVYLKNKELIKSVINKIIDSITTDQIITFIKFCIDHYINQLKSHYSFIITWQIFTESGKLDATQITQLGNYAFLNGGLILP